MEPKVKEYIDYREYLRAIYEFFKQSQPRFSFQSFTDLLGLGNRSFIQNVLRKVKDLPVDRVSSICQGLDLSADDAEYFELLVKFDAERNPEDKNRLWTAIRASQSEVLAKNIEGSTLVVFEQWHTVAVLELLGQGFSDPRLIGRRLLPHVSVADVRKDIEILLNHDFVKLQEDGSYQQTNPHIIVPTPREDVYVGVMRSFQSKMMDVAKDALTNIPTTERYVETITGTFSQQNFKLIEEQFIAIRKLVQDLGNEEQGDNPRVYQVNVALFPISIPKEQDPTNY